MPESNWKRDELKDTESAPKRKWAGIVAINAILLLTAGLLILDHLAKTGQLAPLMANFTGTPEPTPIGPGIDVAAANDYFSTSADIATLRSVEVLDDNLDAVITLHYYLDPTLTRQVTLRASSIFCVLYTGRPALQQPVAAR